MKIKNVKEKAKKVGLMSTVFVTLFGAVNVIGPKNRPECDDKDVMYSQVNGTPDMCNNDQPKPEPQPQPEPQKIEEDTVVEEDVKYSRKTKVEPKRNDVTPKPEEVIESSYESGKEVEVRVDVKEENTNFEYVPEVVVPTQEDYKKIQVIVDDTPVVQPTTSTPSNNTVVEPTKGSQGEEIYVSPSDLAEAEEMLGYSSEEEIVETPHEPKIKTGYKIDFDNLEY